MRRSLLVERGRYVSVRPLGGERERERERESRGGAYLRQCIQLDK